MFSNFPNFSFRDPIPPNVCSGVIVCCLIVSSVCFGKGARPVAKAFLLMLIIKNHFHGGKISFSYFWASYFSVPPEDLHPVQNRQSNTYHRQRLTYAKKNVFKALDTLRQRVPNYQIVWEGSA